GGLSRSGPRVGRERPGPGGGRGRGGLEAARGGRAARHPVADGRRGPQAAPEVAEGLAASAGLPRGGQWSARPAPQLRAAFTLGCDRQPSLEPREGRPSIARGVNPWFQATTDNEPRRGDTGSKVSLSPLRGFGLFDARYPGADAPGY